MNKHAYLIIAHNEFEILKLLVNALDDARNDIYIHFDAKCKDLPNLECNESGLYILQDRIDVRWGDYSQIETEILLFEYAHNIQDKTGVNYLYYHLILRYGSATMTPTTISPIQTRIRFPQPMSVTAFANKRFASAADI